MIELEQHISLLHEYNDIKDVSQMLLGKLGRSRIGRDCLLPTSLPPSECWILLFVPLTCQLSHSCQLPQPLFSPASAPLSDQQSRHVALALLSSQDLKHRSHLGGILNRTYPPAWLQEWSLFSHGMQRH